jgi:AcrR family transcriptional regulator
MVGHTTMKAEVSRLKRDLILGVATRLFAERGYPATTIDAIAEELKASKRSVYEHFSSKSEMLVVVCEESLRLSVEIAERAKARARPLEQLENIAVDFTNLVIEKQDYISVASRELKFLPDSSRQRVLDLQERFDQLLSGILAEGMEQGVFQIEDPKVKGLAISGMIIWVHRWYRRDGRLTPSELAEQIKDIVLRIVCPNPIRRGKRS